MLSQTSPTYLHPKSSQKSVTNIDTPKIITFSKVEVWWTFISWNCGSKMKNANFVKIKFSKWTISNGERKVTVGKFKSAWHILDFNRIKISFLAFVQNSKCTNVTSHDTARLSISASLPAPPPPKIWYNILPILNQNEVFIEMNTQNMAICALRRWLRCVSSLRLGEMFAGRVWRQKIWNKNELLGGGLLTWT